MKTIRFASETGLGIIAQTCPDDGDLECLRTYSVYHILQGLSTRSHQPQAFFVTIIAGKSKTGLRGKIWAFIPHFYTYTFSKKRDILVRVNQRGALLKHRVKQ